MTVHEPGDRRVIRYLIGGDHPVGNVLTTVTLNPTRGELPRRIGVAQKAHHHRRLVGRSAFPVRAIGRIERIKIQLTHRCDHEPRQMVLRQPVPQRRRQQKRLLTITIPKVLTHPDIQLNPPDDPDLRDSLATFQPRQHSSRAPSKVSAKERPKGTLPMQQRSSGVRSSSLLSARTTSEPRARFRGGPLLGGRLRDPHWRAAKPRKVLAPLEHVREVTEQGIRLSARTDRRRATSYAETCFGRQTDELRQARD